MRSRKGVLIGLGGVVSLGVITLLLGSCIGREAGNGLVMEPVQLTGKAQASTADPTPTNNASLLDTALAKVQDAAQELVSTRPDTGLQAKALSDPALRELLPKLGQAEARLIAIYRLTSQGRHREALVQADELVRDHPNFQLAHLVHGDLLSLQMRAVSQLGDVPDTKAREAAEQLQALREESVSYTHLTLPTSDLV